MKRVLCEKLPQPHQPTVLSEAESTHLTRVFRLKDGDRVEAMDGKGQHAAVTLRTRNGAPRLEFLEKATSSADTDQRVPVVLEMSILKGDAMEWVVEKAVELGISTLVPVITAHTIVQVDKKGPEAFRERWQKIADQALKQCGRLDRLEIKTPVELESLLMSTPQAVRLWCDEDARGDATTLMSWLSSRGDNDQTPSESNVGEKGPSSKGSLEVRILIGPEGGWSELERELISRAPGQHSMISLGPLVLRAETAAIFALSLVSADYREKM